MLAAVVRNDNESKGGSMETRQEAVTVIRAKDPAGRDGGGENLPETGYILKVKPNKI